MPRYNKKTHKHITIINIYIYIYICIYIYIYVYIKLAQKLVKNLIAWLSYPDYLI